MPQPAILSVGTAVPRRFSQEEAFRLTGYTSPRIRQIFLNSDIDYRHFWLNPEGFVPNETPDQLHARYRDGAYHLACLAARSALTQAQLEPEELDAVFVATCTGYLCPDLATLLTGHLRMRNDVQRGALLGHGCAGALPLLQRAHDYAAAHPRHRVLAIAVEICSACYYFDTSMETVVGNAICADGAAAVIVSTESQLPRTVPRLLAFETVLDPEQLDKVGFEQKEGKLRIILASEIRDLAGPIIEKCLTNLFRKTGVSRSHVSHWVLHPGGRKVLDKVSEHLDLGENELAPARHVLRNFGNMSSPTALFVLDEIQHNAPPSAGEYGVILALGPGFACEAALVRWEGKGVERVS